MAVTVAFPFGMLGTLIINTFKMCTTALVHKADTYAEQGNAHMIRVLAFGAPLIYLPLTIIPVTIINFYGPDMVVNFAAESHVDRSIENLEVFLDTNIKGTAVLMDAFRGMVRSC